MTPDFLRVEDVLSIHEDQIERYGGARGLRDRGLLISAVETPQAGFDGAYLHDDLFSMAAAYLYHIVQNHPFIDGNKRAGAAAALVFLDLNDVDVVIAENDLVEIVLSTARGDTDKDELARFLRTRAQ